MSDRPEKPSFLRPAVFLDRDGVLNRDREEFVRTLEEFELYPQAVRAAARLSRAGLPVVIASNQSGIARGYLPEATADAMMHRLKEAVEAEGGRIAGIYHCPHSPEDGCDCRKPLPGLLLQAARDLHLDLSRSVMVGDSKRDLEAAAAAGCAATVLTLTGKVKPDDGPVWESWQVKPDHVSPTLEAAVPWILARMGRSG
ncbi:MAG: D-glycero-beta-D-manno-heptose 1,7-bisphosphate 7-phosphatase [Armatimonadetes bacterium]|nr:D-glycero-beta-D-manno-heptose 1,7-bisphosphate 7-phosphatase [Armatimonadota bacterium]